MPEKKIVEFGGCKYAYRGNGPKATGADAGWRMASTMIARCVDCGGFVTLDFTVDEACDCRKLSKDCIFGRFGSRLGDDAIEIYEKIDPRWLRLLRFLHRRCRRLAGHP